ncbi:MAG: glycosyltransferase involved in cell wall biosynthesis [Verrucomicrobiales bacterium]
MKVIYLTAGAAGMYCGSCMRDNSLTVALRELGCETLLVPTYTPIRTDEQSVAEDRIFFGGINVYLEQKFPLFRKLPDFLTGWLSSPKVIGTLTRRSIKIKASELGDLTLSMLRGEHGNQAKEVTQLVEWLSVEKPDLINLTNLLIGGFIPTLKRHLDCPVVVTLQGDDLFLGQLVEPHRSAALIEIKKLARDVDAFVVNSRYYADEMAQLLEQPTEKFHIVPLGADATDILAAPASRHDGTSKNLGYFARICPEKGFDLLVDAFIELKKLPAMEQAKFKVAGWLGANDEEFFQQQVAKIEAAGLSSDFHHAGSPDRDAKREFLRGLDVFSVPTTYREPKGIYVIEALAAGIPVVQPDHGHFPELLARTGGGILFPAGDRDALVENLVGLLEDTTRRRTLGNEGRKNVATMASANRMAEETLAVYRSLRTARAKT